ncbi:MAG: acetyl-CoA synthase subunit gamma [Deltaproteobacteria bacterium]|nr:acetyl-CoA synthase subunit gamma [Deltaproteobacteria bacterium]
MRTGAGTAPKVVSEWASADWWGAFKARWGVGRMHYKVDPGLYALNEPDASSPVLVTANYKLTFDRLRKALPSLDAWLLVLDTDGINVWCAAGKGAFCEEEIAVRIEASSLASVVNHRDLILPQLAGPGTAAYTLKKKTGFKAHYGPIRAEDIKAFLDAGMKATPEMRRKTFGLRERAVLIPVELVDAVKYGAMAAAVMFFLGGLGGPGSYWANALEFGLFAVWAILGAVAAGAVLTPLLLPWLPGRAFSTKGMIVGLAAAVLLVVLRRHLAAAVPVLELGGWLLMVPALASFLGMNFTGASTYTSLSGVQKEMRWALPLQIGAAAVGLSLWIGSRFM